MTDAASSAPFFAASGLTLRYPGAETKAVDGVGFTAKRGEVITLLGPSGCGKTTALRLVAGLETPDAGTITLGRADITHMPPERRNMGFVFQNYALFPHLTVAENVAFGLRVRKTEKSAVSDAVDGALDLVGLAGFGSRRVDQLSGGQQQRVALARALAIKPDVLLLDEPLSNLDATLREQTREALREVLSQLEVTTFFVTHDQAEAFAFSDQIVLMRAGRVVETGTPERLYREPDTPFAAEFLGGANRLAATVVSAGAEVSVGEWRLDARSWSAPAAERPSGSAVLVVARPERLTLGVEQRANSIGGRIVDRVYLGASYRLTVDLDGVDARVKVLSNDDQANGPVWVHCAPDALRVVDQEA